MISRNPCRSQYAHEIGDAGHRPVLVHDLADHAGGDKAGEAGEVDRGLRLSGAVEHAAVARPQREDVAGLDEVGGAVGGIDRDLDRVRAVRRRDPRRHPFARLDGDGEGGAEWRLVALGHRRQAELLAALAGETEADEATAHASP